LFLDEIAELSPSMQSKLLRVLEDQTFRRVGGIEDIEVDVRVVAATNIRLAEAVQRGRFRVDLFHRLTVIPISLPPLRERAADIVPLAQFFVQQSVLKHKSKVAELSREAIEALLGYDWPGNVRELRNVIERAVLMEETETIQLSSIRFMRVPVATSGMTRSSDAAPPLFADLSLEHAKRELMLRALKQTGGNQTKAARLLGISRDMLRHRIKKLQLKVEKSMP
jgi:transcriptional regulator with PAS, ATPase and Fis domain